MQNAGQSPVGGSRTSGVDPGNGKMSRTPDLERGSKIVYPAFYITLDHTAMPFGARMPCGAVSSIISLNVPVSIIKITRDHENPDISIYTEFSGHLPSPEISIYMEFPRYPPMRFQFTWS